MLAGHITVRVSMDLAEAIVAMDHYAEKAIRTFVKMVEYASKLNLY